MITLDLEDMTQRARCVPALEYLGTPEAFPTTPIDQFDVGITPDSRP